MEGGNGATIGSGITQFAEGEPKRLKRAYQNDAAENRTGSRTKSAKDLSRKERKEMKGGNGESEANAVTLCSKCAFQNDEADNLLWM